MALRFTMYSENVSLILSKIVEAMNMVIQISTQLYINMRKMPNIRWTIPILKFLHAGTINTRTEKLPKRYTLETYNLTLISRLKVINWNCSSSTNPYTLVK